MSIANRVAGCNTADSGLEPDKMIQEIADLIRKNGICKKNNYGDFIYVKLADGHIDQAAKEIDLAYRARIEKVGREYLAELELQEKKAERGKCPPLCQGFPGFEVARIEGVKEYMRRMLDKREG